MIVRELVTRLGFAVNDSQLTKYQRGTENIKRSAEGAAESFRNMFVAFAGFSALRSLVAVADEMQSIQARIGQLPQTIGTAAESFDLVSKKASDAKQSIQAYAGFYIKAANATQDYLTNQEDVLKVVDGVAFGLAASGATAVAQSQAFFQLGQAIGSPAVQMEEMNTLIDVAPDLFRALGKAIPGADGNLKKFISTGKVTGQMLAEGLIKVMPEFTAQMKAMPLTVGQATTIVANRWGTFVNRMNRESQAITKIANLFLEMFDYIEVGLDKVVDFFGGATQTLKFFAIAITALVIPALIRLGIGFVALLASPAGILMGILILLLLVIEDIYQWVTGGVSIFGEWAGSFDELIEKVKKFTITLEILKWMGISLATLLTLHFAELAARSIISFAIMAAGWIASFTAMIISALPVVLIVLAIVSAVALLLAGIYYLWDNWQTIWAGMKDIADKVWQGLVIGFNDAINRIKSAWNGFKSFFGMGVSTTVSATQAAGAASSAGGVPTAGGTSSVTINQTLPAGSPEATKMAAREGAKQALDANPMDKAARQMAQAQ